MSLRSLRFHAAPPPGEWINDPNRLVFLHGRFRLFAQHASDAPDFKEIGWARLSSDDLMTWEWEGSVIEPNAEGFAYSGSIAVRPDRLDAYFTRHKLYRNGPLQRQYRATSGDAGCHWLIDPSPIGPEGRNVRDPFVFSAANRSEMMIIARPCDWTDWRQDPPSTLEALVREGDGWHSLGAFGPKAPSGVMFEVAVLVQVDSRWVLIVSLVDRRRGRADGEVRYWLGDLIDNRFEPSLCQPAEGSPLDMGPDFYAAIPNQVAGWPLPSRMIVGWASNWQTAKAMPWPKGIAGGPISMPRILEIGGSRLRQSFIPASAPWMAAERALLGNRWTIEIKRSASSLVISRDFGTLHVERCANDKRLSWQREFPDALQTVNSERLQVFQDGPLVELLIEPCGIPITAALPGEGLDVTVRRLS